MRTLFEFNVLGVTYELKLQTVWFVTSNIDIRFARLSVNIGINVNIKCNKLFFKRHLTIICFTPILYYIYLTFKQFIIEVSLKDIHQRVYEMLCILFDYCKHWAIGSCETFTDLS